MTTPLHKRTTTRCGIEKEAVLAQLERVLEHHTFQSSARSARFLRFVVEYWLEEERHDEQVKERTLGVALFGLDPTYDTTQNTVVRNAAVDVRKRLMMYYLEPGHADEIQIGLAAGSYIPQVTLPAETYQHAGPPDEGSKREHGEESAVQAQVIPNVPVLETKHLRRRNLAFLAVLVLVSLAVGACAGIFIWRQWSSSSLLISREDWNSLNLFWRPVLDAVPPEPLILVCVGQSPQPSDGQQVMPVGNAFATANFARLFVMERAKFRIEVANAFTSEELQSSTVVLVGGPENTWSSFLTETLRFHIASQAGADSKETVWIEDRKNPGRRDWSLSTPSQNSGDITDFAILGRVKDTRSGQWRVIASGLNDVGTSVASRTLSDANYMREITKHLPPGWASKSFEVVISVKVANGKVGYPQLVAYEIW
jgi:hypothetical protein